MAGAALKRTRVQLERKCKRQCGGPKDIADPARSRDLKTSISGPFAPPALTSARSTPAIPECSTCGDELTKETTTPRTTTKSCKHESRTCSSCMQHWIRAQLEDKTWNTLTCPECTESLEHEDVQLLADQETFERFDLLAMRAALSSDTAFRWCISPTCGSGQLHPEGAAEPIFTCNACGHKACVVHDRNWHEGETCEQFDARVKANKDHTDKSEAALNRFSKPCPGPKCSWRIQKNGGCSHMTCSRCGHHFCWDCLAPHGPIFQQGNHMHREGCRLYHPLPRPMPANQAQPPTAPLRPLGGAS